MHSRQFRFQFSPCAAVCPDEKEDQTDVVIFFDERKLRAHAIGHFANTTEMDDWAVSPGWDWNTITHCTERLRDLGCPFFGLDMAHLPPCNNRSYRCPHDDICRVELRPIADAYCRSIHDIIEEIGRLPRYSRFVDKSEQCFCWLFSERCILVRMVWNRDAYNVMTAFNPRQGLNLPWRALLKQTVDRLQMEAYYRIVWCDRATWELDNDSRQTHTRNKRKKTGRYIRKSGQSWRQYLDQ
jgi:hypothetical protein